MSHGQRPHRKECLRLDLFKTVPVGSVYTTTRSYSNMALQACLHGKRQIPGCPPHPDLLNQNLRISRGRA